MKTIAEQIADLEATRAAKAARMSDINTKAAEAGLTLDETEQDEFDNVDAEVKACDAQLVRLQRLDAINKSTAKPVAGKTEKDASDSRGGSVSVKANVPKGTAFTRYAIALARSRGNLMQAVEIAKGWSDTTPEVATILRAAVAAGNTTDVAWAAPLAEYTVASSEFAELLRPSTIIGRIPGMRNVPFNIKVPRQTAGSSVGWVGEGAPKPVSALAFDTITFTDAKAAGIVVLTDELVRASNPSAEAVVRGDLIASMAQFLDAQFLDPGKAATANISPASISNGVVAIVASGTTSDALRADMRALMSAFVTSNMGLGGAVVVMSETMALGVSMMTNALGQPEFPGVTGGTFMGLPLVTSENLTTSAVVGPPAVAAGQRIYLIKASEIMLADDGRTMLDVSREASLQMDSAPVAGAQQLVSLWQNNLVALRAERYINWAKRRAGAVQFITSAAYV